MSLRVRGFGFRVTTTSRHDTQRQNQVEEQRQYQYVLAKYSCVTQGWTDQYRQKDPTEVINVKNDSPSAQPKVPMVGIRALTGAALLELLRHYGLEPDLVTTLGVALWSKLLIWVARFQRSSEGELESVIPQRLRSKFDPLLEEREGRLSYSFNEHYALKGGAGDPIPSKNLGGAIYSLTGLGEVDVAVALIESQNFDPKKTWWRCHRDPFSVLGIAIRQGNTSFVKYLLENGVNPNKRDPCRNSPLSEALSSPVQGLEIINLLLSYGAKPRLLSQARYVPYNFNRVSAVKRLLEAGADPNLRDNRGYSPLDFEICGRPTGTDGRPYCKADMENVKALIDAGADLDAPFDPSVQGEFDSGSDEQSVVYEESVDEEEEQEEAMSDSSPGDDDWYVSYGSGAVAKPVTSPDLLLKSAPSFTVGGVIVTSAGSALTRQQFEDIEGRARREASTWKWEFDGKGGSEWFAYTDEASVAVEMAFQSWLDDPNVSVRAVKSGDWHYMVNFNLMQQQNVGHASHRPRNVRRIMIDSPDTIWDRKRDGY